MEQYFIANDVTDEKKQTGIFLTIIGNETYRLLRNLLAPESPAGETVKTLSETLIDHLKPQPIIIAERYYFYCRDQLENETITEYLAELRKLTLNCDFKDFLDQALRDRFVCGLQNNSIRRRLLSERKLTLKSAIELPKTMDNADLETQIIATDIKTENINAMNNATRKCYRCNSTKHLANVCRFKDAKCNNCRMKGNRTHQTDPSLKMPAYQKTATPKPTSNIVKQMQTPPTNDVQKNIDSNSDEDSSSFYIHKINPTKPLCVTLGIQDSTIKIEIDTGSGITLISEGEYCTHFQNLPLTGTKIKVGTYANESLKVLGKLIVDVSYENKIYNRLPLYVIKGSGVSLLGRNWMTLMRLNWESIFEQLQEQNLYQEKVNRVNIQKELETVTNKYPNIFFRKIGHHKRCSG